MRNALGLAVIFKGQAVALREESKLQVWAAGRLRDAGVDFEEQVVLGPRDRLDFLVGAVAIELKTRGSVSDLLRQLDRYAQSERVAELLVITTRRQLTALPKSLRGKPILAEAVGAF